MTTPQTLGDQTPREEKGHSTVYPTLSEAEEILQAVQLLFHFERGWDTILLDTIEFKGGFMARWHFTQTSA